MTQCSKCKKIKYWFQFTPLYLRYFTVRGNLCRKCAKDVANKAVQEAVDLATRPTPLNLPPRRRKVTKKSRV